MSEKRILGEYTEESYYHEPKPHVLLLGEYVRCEDLEVLNVEEDMQGRDLLTFNYQGETHQSLVYLK
jgi:hypothetical protein